MPSHAIAPRPIAESLIRDLVGSRLSGFEITEPMFKDEIEAVHFGDKWNKDKDMERALILYRDFLGQKVKKAFRVKHFEDVAPTARELKLVKIALMVVQADKPEGARFAWVEVKTEPYKALVYAAIFLASVISIRCCIPPKKDEGRETVLRPDGSGDYDVAWKWELNGITFVYFPRNSKLMVEQNQRLRRPTQAEQEMFHQARLNTDGARLVEIGTNVACVNVGRGFSLPFLKEFLEKRGFQNVQITAIDDGYWMADDTLPNPDKEARQEVVSLADRYLMTQTESQEFRIRYLDLFDGFPKEYENHFDVLIMTPGNTKATTSYMFEALKMLKDDGLFMMRIRLDQKIYKQVLIDSAKEAGYTPIVMKTTRLPNPDKEFTDEIIILKKAEFTDKAKQRRVAQLYHKIFGARLSVGMAA